MSGIKYLLDTNIIIGLLNHNPAVINLVVGKNITVNQYAYSAITRMELLSFHKMIDAEKSAVEQLLSRMRYLPITKAIEDRTIIFRSQHKGKLPDAIIAATGLFHQLTLLTLDKNLSDKLVMTFIQDNAS